MNEPKEDILWKMLNAELGMIEIRELEDYLRGNSDHFDMGYGELVIEPYDSHGGSSKLFLVRHERLGQEKVSRSALKSLLHDLRHSLQKKMSRPYGDVN